MGTEAPMTTLLPRRLLLGASLAFPLARAVAADAPPEPASVMGKPDAKLVVKEWFSLTCTHCASFAVHTLPEVKAKLIDTGRIRYEFYDFPSDQVALMAAEVARALPAERYEPFIMALFANQQRWAFAEGVNPQAELQKMALLAGLSPAGFQKAITDPAIQAKVLADYNYGANTYQVDSTPTFVFGKEVYRQGDMPYAEFEKRVAANGG